MHTALERDQSVEEMRRASERTRAELAVTVGQLRDKVGETTAEIKTLVSPAHIKSEFRTYVREERESIVGSLEQKARDNPLQAAAIGAALAYPAWGLLRAIPGPLLLIGAGLWLTGKRGRRTIEQAKAAAADVYEQGSNRASAYAGAVQGDIAERTSGARAAAAAASSRVSDEVDNARARANDLRDTVTSSVSDALDTAKKQASDFADMTTEQASEIKAGARSSSNTVIDFVNQNPLLVAGLGAAAGAFIAASMPPSDAESRLFGATSASLKRKAREVASEGLNDAKHAVAGVAADMAVAAAREGLNREGLQKAADVLVDGFRAVAERGMSGAPGDVSEGRDANRQQTEQQHQNPNDRSDR